MPKRMSITFDDDAADLLPKLAARAGKPHRVGQYLSDLLRTAAEQAAIVPVEQEEPVDITALNRKVRKLTRELATVKADVAILKARGGATDT